MSEIIPFPEKSDFDQDCEETLALISAFIKVPDRESRRRIILLTELAAGGDLDEAIRQLPPKQH